MPSGYRMVCLHCGSLKVKFHRKDWIVCKDCGYESNLEQRISQKPKQPFQQYGLFTQFKKESI